MCGLQSSLNARVIYSNLPGNHIQLVYGIQHDHKKQQYAGYIWDKRTWSHSLVFAHHNQGPFYEWWSWLDLLKSQMTPEKYQAYLAIVREENEKYKAEKKVADEAREKREHEIYLARTKEAKERRNASAKQHG